MEKTTRRGAIATMAAAATVAVAPAYATDDDAHPLNLTPDPVVALADGCKRLLAEYVEAKRISSALYGEVCEATDSLFEAVRVAGLGNPKYEALRQRWLDEFTHQTSVTGYGKAHEAVNRISRQLRKRVAQLVGTRATTIRGAMAKLEIMSAIDHECEEPGIYEEHDEWLSIVRADLERIAGGAS